MPLRPSERSFVGLRCPSGLLPRNVSASAIAGATLTPMIGQTASTATAQAGFPGLISYNAVFQDLWASSGGGHQLTDLEGADAGKAPGGRDDSYTGRTACRHTASGRPDRPMRSRSSSSEETVYNCLDGDR